MAVSAIMHVQPISVVFTSPADVAVVMALSGLDLLAGSHYDAIVTPICTLHFSLYSVVCH